MKYRGSNLIRWIVSALGICLVWLAIVTTPDIYTPDPVPIVDEECLPIIPHVQFELRHTEYGYKLESAEFGESTQRYKIKRGTFESAVSFCNRIKEAL